MCTLKEAQVKYTPFQEVKLHPLGWSSAHSLDKSLASYKLSSRFSFRFWAIDERTPDTWCPRLCQRLESCPMLADKTAAGTCAFLVFDKTKWGHCRK